MRLKYLMVMATVVFLAGVVTLAGSCAKEPAAPTQIIKELAPQEAFALIEANKKDPNFIVVDVRTPAEYTEGHIENAVNVDFNSGAFRDDIGTLDRSKKYLIYCRSGNRSRGALAVMRELGFREMYHLSAGIIAWSETGYPLAR